MSWWDDGSQNQKRVGNKDTDRQMTTHTRRSPPSLHCHQPCLALDDRRSLHPSSLSTERRRAEASTVVARSTAAGTSLNPLHSGQRTQTDTATTLTTTTQHRRATTKMRHQNEQREEGWKERGRREDREGEGEGEMERRITAAMRREEDEWAWVARVQPRPLHPPVRQFSWTGRGR